MLASRGDVQASPPLCGPIQPVRDGDVALSSSERDRHLGIGRSLFKGLCCGIMRSRRSTTGLEPRYLLDAVTRSTASITVPLL